MHLGFTDVLTFCVLCSGASDSGSIHGTEHCFGCVVIVYISGKPPVPFENVGWWLPTGGSLFPPDLSDKLVAIVGALGFHCTALECNFSWQAVLQHLPIKERQASPHALVDGGGVFSYPGWSEGRRPANDILQGLRHTLMSFCGKHKIPSRLREHVEAASESPVIQCRRDCIAASARCAALSAGGS